MSSTTQQTASTANGGTDNDRSLISAFATTELKKDEPIESRIESWIQQSIQPGDHDHDDIISRLRHYLTSEITRMDNVTTSIDEETSKIEKTVESWENAGIASFLSALDKEAIQETQQIAEIAALLNLSSPEITDEVSVLMSVMPFVNESSVSEYRHANRKHLLNERKAKELNESVEFLRYASDVENKVDNDVKIRTNDAQLIKKRVGVMGVKAKQYEDAASVAMKEVRQCGLEVGASHDAVVKQVDRLLELEQSLNDVNKALSEFHDLPPVCFFFFFFFFFPLSLLVINL